jgi:hypothetical protein
MNSPDQGMADAIRRYNTNAANVSQRDEAVVCIENSIHVDAAKEQGKLAPGSVRPAGSGSVTIYTQVA